MIQYVVDFIKMCPFVADKLLTADFLGEKPCSIGVFVRATDPVVERYVDGGLLKQFVFRVSVRYSNHEAQPEEASRLLKQVGDWLEKQATLPEGDSSFMPQRFEILKSGAPAGREYGTNRYDMDCRLIYYTEKRGNEG